MMEVDRNEGNDRKIQGIEIRTNEQTVDWKYRRNPPRSNDLLLYCDSPRSIDFRRGVK